MPPTRPQRPTGFSGLDWIVTDDGSLTLLDCKLNETFHSGCGAVAESLVVYLCGSGVFERLMHTAATRVFELGFGTGMNFLLTAAIAERFQTSLEYWAIDHRIVPAAVVGELAIGEQHLPKILADNPIRPHDSATITVEDFDAIPSLTLELVQWILDLHSTVEPIPSGDAFRLVQCPLAKHVRLNLLVGDATALPYRVAHANPLGELRRSFDAVYFDAFSPESTPELWTHEIFETMFRMLRPGGTLASYCVKSRVRQLLSQLGFVVERIPGPKAGKREVLRAVVPNDIS